VQQEDKRSVGSNFEDMDIPIASTLTATTRLTPLTRLGVLGEGLGGDLGGGFGGL
jgi:hypothetical protein